MVEAVMFWNEPNNISHWDFSLDPEWRIFGDMVKCAATAVSAEASRMTRVLGGISPIDPLFIRRMAAQGVLAAMDAVAVHGFPLDWNHWQINEWPAKLAETLGLTETIRAIPITKPEAVHTIGLVVPQREPMTPLNAALVAEARALAKTLDG